MEGEEEDEKVALSPEGQSALDFHFSQLFIPTPLSSFCRQTDRLAGSV